MSKYRDVLLSFCAVFLMMSGLYAQNNLSQQISGTVTDASGAALANATVTITNAETGLTRTTKTNTSGNYTAPELPTGKYKVTVEAPGFAKQIVDNNPLNTNVSIEVNVKMQVGSQTESVTIQADAVVVETSNGELGFTVTGEQASELQLNGRNFPELLALLPGVSTTYTDGFGLFGGYGVNNSGQSINGGRTDTTTWNLDGADNKDNGGGGNNFVNINPDAIGEFRVLTSNFSAVSGTSSGAVVNISIRSGTKDIHGKLYEYWRNDHLLATSFNGAGLAKPKLRWNNFGGNLGGPILLPKTGFNRGRDKLFFFYSEDLKYLRTGATSSWTVPTAAQKAGNFGTTNIKDLSGVPYPNNIIPASQMNPDMVKLINIYPAGNQGASTFSGNLTTPTDVHQEVVKVDYNLDEKNQLSFHYVHDFYKSLQNTTNVVQYYREIPGLNASIQWNKVISPTWINLAQFAFSGNVIIEQKDLVANPILNLNGSFTRKGLGINLPTIYGASDVIPQFAIQNMTTLGVSPLNFNNFNRIFNVKDTLTKIMGNHTFTMGFLFMRSRKNQDNPPAINGQYNFTNSRSPSTGQGMADALLGAFQSYTEYPSVREGWYRFSQFEPYFQDDWKVSRRVTVNIGLRWSYMQPQYSALNNTVQFEPQYFDRSKAAVINPSTGTVVSAADPYNGLVLTGTGFPDAAKGRILQYNDPAVKALFRGIPQGGTKTDWGGYAPRLGFAYDVTGKGQTVLRGGFGVAYERIEGNFIFSGINNTPFNPSTSNNNGFVTTPANGASSTLSVQTISNSHVLDMRLPRTLTYSLGVQHKITRDMMLTVTYVGSAAHNLSYIDDINQLPLGTRNNNKLPGTNTLVQTNALRPYPGYGTIQQYTTGANFVYNSLQSSFNKRFKNAGTFTSAFTWAKGRTDANGYSYTPMDSYNLRGDWGTSNYSRKFVFVPSWVYPLPFWRGGGTWYKQAFGGWQVNGVAQVQSGLPLNPTISADQAGTGNGNQRPMLIGDPYSGGTIDGGFQVMNKSAFANPALNTFGNLGAFNVFLPRWINVNSSLVKSFYNHIGDHELKWDARFEMYNVANHLVTSAVNVGGWNSPTQTNWGQKTGTTPPRSMQASVRLNF